MSDGRASHSRSVVVVSGYPSKQSARSRDFMAWKIKAEHVIAFQVIAGIVIGAAYACHITQLSVDLSSGKERVRLLIGGLCIHAQTRETQFSVLVSDTAVTKEQPDWRVVSETGPLQRNSPNFTYHSAPTLLQHAVILGESKGMSLEGRREICIQVLLRLRAGDCARAERMLEQMQAETESPE